jgi:murein DD-endopeptidase MepM/ murein hydrolase activator NlpD
LRNVRFVPVFVLLGCLANPVQGDESLSGAFPRTFKQGDVVVLTLPLRGGESVVPDGFVGRFRDRETPAFPVEGGVSLLLGVDMEEPPGTDELVVEHRGSEGTRVVARVPLTVVAGDFGVQTLSLPEKQVDLDAETLQRVEGEQRTMLTAMQAVTPRAWEGTFVLPSEGQIQKTFGLRRVINGQPRRPHTGEDISAPSGAPVLAINHGTVRLVADHFFSGKSVVIDHGLGLYSMYFHLSAVTVHVGDRIGKTQVIGAVGASGRVSGPHLHWGIRLNGARVNPLSLAAAVSSAARRESLP